MAKKILIAIITCGDNWARADAQRAMWVPDVVGADVRFFLSSQIREPREDEVFFPIDDSYLNLPQKVQCVIAWAWENGYEKIFKVDDDMVVFPARLLSAVPKGDYVGHAPVGQWWCSGLGYWLSRKAMKILATTEIPEDNEGEDRWIGRTLREHKILPVNDQNIFPASVSPRYLAVTPSTKCTGEFVTLAEQERAYHGPKGWKERAAMLAERAKTKERQRKILRGDGRPLFER